ncbi:MAG: DUF3990 domain-containing protein [Elusimicrobia bacterium]|nr:DUF3990 domain-containing protein [Elusimicrobiota bacterium]
MKILKLYHGSPQIIEKPIFGKGNKYNDYGLGFYCTENIDLAKEWACAEDIDGYANCYEFNTDKLKILHLSEYHILYWLTILINNREFSIRTPIMKRSKEYLSENFMIDVADYDIIIGYRADDSYFSFARAFLNNEISLRQLSYAMKLGKLGEQIVLKSKKAFDRIKFINYEKAANSIFYTKRKNRDTQARLAFQKELESDDINGIFIRDIIRQELKENDIRKY